MKKVHHKLTNEAYLDGLQKQKREVLENIYAVHFPVIAKYISSMGGNEAIAKDIFQEGLIVVYEKAKAEELNLTCAFGTYLFAVCKRMYLKKSSTNRVSFGLETELKEEVLDDNIIERINKSERYALYREKFNLLGKDCKKILSLFFNKVSMEEISRMMGFSSAGYAKKRKFNCKKQLIELIKADQRYEELTED